MDDCRYHIYYIRQVLYALHTFENRFQHSMETTKRFKKTPLTRHLYKRKKRVANKANSFFQKFGWKFL